MIFRFAPFLLDIDTEKTRRFYEKSSQTLTEGCDCIDCRNFVKASEHFPPEIKKFFAQLGVDICKAPDMSVMCPGPEGKTLYYFGFCHLCGTICQGESAWVQESPERACWDESRVYQVADGCRVSFSEKLHLLEKDFPEPVIQMDVDIEVPWVIEGERHFMLK